jgi:hypothetical protein
MPYCVTWRTSASPPRRASSAQGWTVPAASDTAWEADAASVTPELTAHPIALWAMAWRARSAAWMIRHRRTFETALIPGGALNSSEPAKEPSAGTMIAGSFDRYLAKTARDHERRLVNQPSDRADGHPSTTGASSAGPRAPPTAL